MFFLAELTGGKAPKKEGFIVVLRGVGRIGLLTRKLCIRLLYKHFAYDNYQWSVVIRGEMV